MTCNDCPHFDVCKMYGAFHMKRRISSKWKNCPFRNDKAKYIELPCKVGDEVYKVFKSEHFGNHIHKMTIRKFGIFAHTNFEMIFGTENNWDVFFDKSKAEARLKELNNETS